MPEPLKVGRRPDAIRCPRTYPNRPGKDRDVERNLLFGKWLGSRRVTSSEYMDTNESFVVPHPTIPQIKHPYGHPNQLEDRYEWFILSPEKGPNGEPLPGLPEVGDEEEAGRIKLGYLKDDPHAEDPAVQSNVRATYEQRLKEAAQDPEHRDRLVALNILAPVPASPAAKAHAPGQPTTKEGDDAKA